MHSRWQVSFVQPNGQIARLLLPLVTPLLVMWGLAAHAAGTNRTVLVGFSQDTLANDWRLAQVTQIRDALARIPNVTLMVTDGKGSTAQQIRDIEDLVDSKVDILITSPRDEKAMTPVLAGFHRSGTPVVLLTRRIASESYTTYISPNDEEIGRSAALEGQHQFVSSRKNGRADNASVATASTTGFQGYLKESPPGSASKLDWSWEGKWRPGGRFLEIHGVLKVAGNEAPVVSYGLIFEDGIAHFEISGDG